MTSASHGFPQQQTKRTRHKAGLNLKEPREKKQSAGASMPDRTLAPFKNLCSRQASPGLVSPGRSLFQYSKAIVHNHWRVL
jgi:hypothetical protein